MSIYREKTVLAAAAAIAQHTASLWIDDDGRPAEVGMWHLLASLVDVAEEEGFDLTDALAEARKERDLPLYFVRLLPKLHDTMADPVDCEVKAQTLMEACLKVIDGVVPGDTVTTVPCRDATGVIKDPQPARYAMVLDIVAKNPRLMKQKIADVKEALRAVVPNPKPRLPITASEVKLDMVSSAKAALAIHAKALGGGPAPDVKAEVKRLLDSLMDYADRTCTDVEADLSDVMDQRPSWRP